MTVLNRGAVQSRAMITRCISLDELPATFKTSAVIPVTAKSLLIKSDC